MKAYCSKFINALLAILLCVPQFAFALVDDYSVETYSKDETYAHFTNSLSGSSSFNSSCDSSNSKVLIYATIVLRKHPDYVAKLVNDFASFDSCQQRMICASLTATGFNNEIRTINDKNNSACLFNDNIAIQNINNIQFLNKIETYEDAKLQASYMDHYWAAYFATGDESYIAKMVEYARLHKGQSGHEYIISEFEYASTVIAQKDPAFNDLLVKHYHVCLGCFR